MFIVAMDYDLMPHTEETVQMLDTLVPDGTDPIELENFLRCLPTYAVFTGEGSFCGFFTKEEVSDVVEIHCYILPSKRKVSMTLLRTLYKELTSKGLTIKTSVFSHFGYIIRVLQMLGFNVTNTEKGVATKGGKPFDVIYLTT